MTIKVYRYDLEKNYDSRKPNPFNKNEFEMLYDGNIARLLHNMNNNPQYIELNNEGILELLKKKPCAKTMDERLISDFDMFRNFVLTPRFSHFLNKNNVLKKHELISDSTAPMPTLQKQNPLHIASSSGSHSKKKSTKRRHKRGKKHGKHHKKTTHRRHKRDKKHGKHHKKTTHRRHKRGKKHDKHHKKTTHRRHKRGKN